MSTSLPPRSGSSLPRLPPPVTAVLWLFADTFSKFGFPGAVCSIDGVHCKWECCPVSVLHQHKGKEGYTTKVWNVACGPMGQFISVPPAHPGARNDKTLAQYDPWMQELRGGVKYADLEFTVHGVHGPEVLTGPYAIVDNGYHHWRCLQFPVTVTSDKAVQRWSKRLESLRKVSERQYGILKKRFRCLKNGALTTSGEHFDHMFRACCMLHNMLLRYDRYLTMGSSGEDWMTFDVATDEARIGRDDLAGAHQAGVSHGHSAVNGNVVESQKESAHWELRNKLVYHYTRAHERAEVQWLKKAMVLRPRVKRVFMTTSSAEDTEISSEDSVWES